MPLKMALIGGFNQVVRWHMPCGKDPGEMFKNAAVRHWVLAGLPPVYHYRNGPFPLNRKTERGAAQCNAWDYLVYAMPGRKRSGDIGLPKTIMGTILIGLLSKNEVNKGNRSAFKAGERAKV